MYVSTFSEEGSSGYDKFYALPDRAIYVPNSVKKYCRRGLYLLTLAPTIYVIRKKAYKIHSKHLIPIVFKF